MIKQIKTKTVRVLLSFAGLSICLACPVCAEVQPRQTDPEREIRLNLPPAPDSKEMQQLAQRQFELSTEQVLPLTPEQIKQFKGSVGKTTEALRLSEPPTMNTRSAKLKLEPGVMPPVIQLAPGYVSTILIYDVSGAPWPITSITTGNTNYFSVHHNESLKPGNMLTISPIARYAHTNIAVTLEGQSLPVILQVRTDDRDKGAIHDSLVSFQTDMRGPLAEKPSIGGGQNAKSVVNETMLAFLDGAPPSEAKYVSSKPSFEGVSVWEYMGQTYLRTRYPAMWPAWTTVVNGAGKIRVYKMPIVPSIMLTVGGTTQTINLGDS